MFGYENRNLVKFLFYIGYLLEQCVKKTWQFFRMFFFPSNFGIFYFSGKKGNIRQNIFGGNQNHQMAKIRSLPLPKK
jgi:hypothetical protein